MADENEVLDWDEDDAQAPLGAATDDEDAVSLGASDEELDAPDPETAVEELPPPSPAPDAEDTTPTKRRSTPPPRQGRSSSRKRDRGGDRERERLRESRDDRDRDSRDRGDGHGHRERERRPHKMTVAQPVTHALPPKPVTTVPAFMHPSHPSSIEATMMAPSSIKDAKDGKPKSGTTPNGAGTSHTNIKSSSTDRDNYKSSGADREPLPDDWEVRQSRNPTSTNSSSSSYYYNTRTLKSTWERPRGDERERERRSGDDRAHPRSDDRDRAHATRGQHHRDGDGPLQNSNSSGHVDSAQNEDDGMSYKDRHYRPEGAPDVASGTPTASTPGTDRNAHSLGSRPPQKSPSPPSRGGRGRGRGRGDEHGSGNGRWSPPLNPNNIRSTSASMSSYPDPTGDFNSKRPPGWDRDRKYRDSRDSTLTREQVGRAPHDRGDPERDRDQRSVQGQGYGPGRPLDDGEPRGYQPRSGERERQDIRERDREPREQRDARERDVPGRDDRARRDNDGWPRDRERDVPPHQYDRKQDSAYDSRKPYGRDAQSRSNNQNLSQTQSHPREREVPPHREPPSRERDAPPPMHRDPPRDPPRERDPQPQRSHPIMSAPSTLTLRPKPTLLRLRHSFVFCAYAYWW
ncbi:hypothetical protein C8R47DRAFT_444784 [Mycena vitilis]|nr:hypothetical protein C8R47DRAFT_444784 [Mycena vitilis]